MVVFVVIEFCLVIIPFAFLEFPPEGTKVHLKRAQDWLTTQRGSSWPQSRSSPAPT